MSDHLVARLYDARDVDGDGAGDIEAIPNDYGVVGPGFAVEQLSSGGVVNEPSVPWSGVLPPMTALDAAAKPLGAWGAYTEAREPEGGGDPAVFWLGLEWYPPGATDPTVRLDVGDGLYFTSAALGDLDGDGTPDPLATIRESTSSWTTLWYPSSAGFAPAPGPTAGPMGPLVSGGDVDGDGRDDWLTYGSQVAVYLAPPAEGVGPDLTVPSSDGTTVTLADADDDGHDDVIISNRPDDARTFRHVEVYTDPAAGVPSTTWDVTEDDIVFVHRLAGHGTSAPYSMVDVGDIDGDGVRELAVGWGITDPVAYDAVVLEIDLWDGDL